MLSSNVTVCIFAYNEERRLVRCIDNFRGLFPILVVDNCSTDATRAVAEREGCAVVSVKNPGYIETDVVMDPVFAACSTDYILIASVSEFVPRVLLERYAAVANGRTHAIVKAFRESITAGLAIPISGSPRTHPGELRFLRRGSVDFSGTQVHETGRMLVGADEILNLVQSPTLWFYQFRDYDSSHTERKHGGYNDVLAKQRFDRGEKFGWLRFVLLPLKQFLNCYFRFGAWRFGMPGFIQSYFRWQMEVGILLRIWEWQNDFDGKAVIERNNVVRRRLEAEFEATGQAPDPRPVAAR